MLHGPPAFVPSRSSFAVGLPSTPRSHVLVLCLTQLLLTCAVRPSEQASESTKLVELNPKGTQAQVHSASSTAVKTTNASSSAKNEDKTNNDFNRVRHHNASVDVRKQHRHDLCERMKEVAADKRSIVEALEGATISVIATPGKSYLKQDNDGHFSGYDYELLNTVAGRGKFTVDLSFQKTHLSAEFAKQEEQYEELIKTYDVVLDHMTEKYSRDKRMLFPVFDHLDASLVLVHNRGVATARDTFHTLVHKVFLISEPYNLWVWLLFALSCIATGILYSLLESSGLTEKLEPEDDRYMPRAIYTGVLHLTTHETFVPRTWPGKILVVSWTAISVVFLAGYTANLATILVMEREERTEWESLADAMKAKARICVAAGTHAQHFIYSHYAGYPYFSAVQDYPLKKMMTGECQAAIIWQMGYEVALLKEEYNPKCRLRRVGDKLNNRFGGWSAYVDYSEHCTVLVRDAIHTIFQALEEEGMLANLYADKLLHDETTKKTLCGEASADAGTSTVSLGVENMGGLFLFHFLGAIVAIVLYWILGRRTTDAGSG